MIGLSEAQQDVVAQLVRHHREVLAPGREPSFGRLPQKERILIAKLVALLRLADAMDASHTGAVRTLELLEKKRKWQLSLHGRGDLTIERWELEKRRDQFEAVFGAELEIRENT